MPKLKFAVEYDDGREEEVTVGRPADLIAFADTFGKVAPDRDGPHVMKEGAWLVHRALKVDSTFEEWIESVADLRPVTVGPAEAAPDPTPEQPEETEAPTVVIEPPEWPRPHRKIAMPTGS